MHRGVPGKKNRAHVRWATGWLVSYCARGTMPQTGLEVVERNADNNIVDSGGKSGIL